MKLFYTIIIINLLFCFKVFDVYSINNRTSLEENEHCLNCHSKKNHDKTMENGEKVNLYIDRDKFKLSAHSHLNCSSCHNEFSESTHPKRRFRDIEQFRKQSNLICRKCHLEEIKNVQIHENYITEAGEVDFLCTNCHSAHSVEHIYNKQTTEIKYCLTCHTKTDNYMYFKNGEKISLYFNIKAFQNSVHQSLNCSNCHFGFSKNRHPKREFNSFRDYKITLSETCRRCHFDKYTRTLESIHNKILAAGRLEAPVCTDCHGSHNIKHFGNHRIEIAQRCQSCHDKIYNTYINSVHGKALIDMVSTDVPICIDCHTAHDIVNPLSGDYRNNIPLMCSNCHNNKNVMDKYGISTEVVKTYIDDFHGKTFSLNKSNLRKSTSYYRKIAVCTDCHGIHNIESMRYLEVNTIKSNLLKRCQECHLEAGVNFPDAWLSHYMPSLQHHPALYIVILIYKVFIPLLIITLILQILLHIWRYAINR